MRRLAVPAGPGSRGNAAFNLYRSLALAAPKECVDRHIIDHRRQNQDISSRTLESRLQPVPLASLEELANLQLAFQSRLYYTLEVNVRDRGRAEG